MAYSYTFSQTPIKSLLTGSVRQRRFNKHCKGKKRPEPDAPLPPANVRSASARDHALSAKLNGHLPCSTGADAANYYRDFVVLIGFTLASAA